MAVCCYSAGIKDWTTACASKDRLIVDDDLVIHVSASGVGGRIIVQLRRTAEGGCWAIYLYESIGNQSKTK